MEREGQPAKWAGIYISQIIAIASANIKSRYRSTVAGFIWVVLNPLLIFLVQSLVFRKILRVEVSNYYLFLVSGLLPWLFIVQSVEMSTSIFVASGGLLKSFRVSPLVILSAQLADNLFNFLMSFSIILLLVSIFQTPQMIGVLYLPLPIFLITIGAVGLACIFATIQVFLRDTRFLVSFGLQIMFFLTPIFYPRSFVPENLRWLIHFNPLGHLIEPFHVCVYNFSIEHFGAALFHAAATDVIICGLAITLWRFKRNALLFHI